MKTERRFNTKALEALAERAKSQKPQNIESAYSNDTDSQQMGMSLILRGNEASRLSRGYAANCITVLAEIMNDSTARHRDRLQAAEILLNRAHGKPAVVAQESVEEVEEADCGLAWIDARGEAIEWLNSGRPQHEWPAHVLSHLGLTDE